MTSPVGSFSVTLRQVIVRCKKLLLEKNLFVTMATAPMDTETTDTSATSRHTEDENPTESMDTGAGAPQSSEGKGFLTVKQGDLFTCPSTDSLAHCVSRDLRMGAGVAVGFKKIFGRVDVLKQQGKGIGDVAVLEDKGRYIYYLITKEKYSDKPTYGDLQKSLDSMKKHGCDNCVKSISMPRIGCGLDKLEWENVEKMLKETFESTDIQITVYEYVPPKPEKKRKNEGQIKKADGTPKTKPEGKFTTKGQKTMTDFYRKSDPETNDGNVKTSGDINEKVENESRDRGASGLNSDQTGKAEGGSKPWKPKGNRKGRGVIQDSYMKK